MNERIRATRVLLIDEAGEQLGEMATTEALAKARASEMDLILVAANAHPPVAKIVDYGKYLYEQKRTARKQRSAGKALAVKGIRLGLRTGEHDVDVRLKQAEKFLAKGHKLKVELRFRGREIQHSDLGIIKLEKFAESLVEVAKPDEPPKKIGRQLIMILSPVRRKPTE